MINFNEIALKFDAVHKPLEAAWAYEIAINEPSADIDLFLNLAVLYFECRDFGYASLHQLSEEFVSNAWLRAFEILRVAEDKFGSQTDILFWREYLSYIYLENEKIDQIVEDLILRADSLTPYLYLFNASGKSQFKDEATKLLDLVKDGSTERKRYIKSVIE